MKISWPLTSDLNRSQSGQWDQVNLIRRSEVTSHWSGPGVRVKRSEVTSIRSNVLYCQRSKVSHFFLGQWVQVNLTRCSKVTSHWSGPGVRVKRSEVTSRRSYVLYCQRLKVSHFIWAHRVKGHKSKVMGMLTSDLNKKISQVSESNSTWPGTQKSQVTVRRPVRRPAPLRPGRPWGRAFPL